MLPRWENSPFYYSLISRCDKIPIHNIPKRRMLPRSLSRGIFNSTNPTLLRRRCPGIIFRNRENSHSTRHYFSKWRKPPILRITLRHGGDSYSTNHYSLRCRRLPFYWSLFEMEETPIRVITLRDRGNSNSTNHYSSRWRSLPAWVRVPLNPRSRFSWFSGLSWFSGWWWGRTVETSAC